MNTFNEPPYITMAYLWENGPESMMKASIWILHNKQDFFNALFPLDENFNLKALMFTLETEALAGKLNMTEGYEHKAILFTMEHAIKVGELKARASDAYSFLDRCNYTFIEKDDLMEWLYLRENRSAKDLLKDMADRLSKAEQERDALKQLSKETATQNKLDSPPNERSKSSFLHLIGALLNIVMENNLYKSETELREYIAEKYLGFSGTAARTTAENFSIAKRLLSQ